MIKQHIITIMNINEIKSAISTEMKIPSLTELMLNQQKDKEGVATPWFAAWDNASRTRVVLHEDVANKIKADKSFNGLALKKEVVAAHKADSGEDIAAYTRFVIITPTVDLVL